MRKGTNYPSHRRSPHKHIVRTRHPRYQIQKYERGRGYLPAFTVEKIGNKKFLKYIDPNLSVDEKKRREQEVLRLLMRIIPKRSQGEFSTILISDEYDGERIKSMAVAHPAGVMQVNPIIANHFFEPSERTSHTSLMTSILHEYGHYDFWFALGDSARAEWRRWYNEEYAPSKDRPFGATLEGFVLENSYREAYASMYSYYNNPSENLRAGAKKTNPETWKKFEELSRIKPMPPINGWDEHLSKMTGLPNHKTFGGKKYEIEHANYEKWELDYYGKKWSKYRSRRSIKYRDKKGQTKYAVYMEARWLNNP